MGCIDIVGDHRSFADLRAKLFLTILLAENNQTNRETNKQINKQTKKQRKKKIMIAIMNPHNAVGVSCRRNACYRSLFCILITASSEILPKCNIAVNTNCSNVAEVYCNTKMSLLWLIKRLKQKSGIQQSHDRSFTWSIILLPFTLTF